MLAKAGLLLVGDGAITTTVVDVADGVVVVEIARVVVETVLAM